MKKYFLIVMYAVILCFCCACQGQTKKSAAVPPINCEYGMRNFAVSGDEGYYFFCNNLFIFWDGNPEHAAMPICDSPDCSHDQSKCPAYIGTMQEAKIFYDNGSLYVFSGEKQHDPVTQEVGYPLWKVAADGSSKEIAMVAKEDPYSYTVFKGVVYYEIQTEDENGKVVCSIQSWPLDGGEEKEIFHSQYQNGALIMIQGIGDLLYFKEGGIDMSIDLEDPELDLENLDLNQVLYAYNPKTEELISNPMNEKEGWTTIIRNVFNEKIYYTFWKSEEENTMWSKEIDGDEEPAQIGTEIFYVRAADPDYMYTTWMKNETDGTHEVKILDHDANVKQVISMRSIDRLDIVPATEEYVFGYFVKMTSEEEGHVSASIVLLERDKIAEGKAEMITLYQGK